MATADGKYRIDFIDPLFAVAIHIGIVEGLMHEEWLHNRGVPLSVSDYSHLATFAAGGMALVLSWVGYHISIVSKPIKSDERFFWDVVLLVLYIALLIYFRQYAIFSFLMFFIFLSYVFWDYGKVKEYVRENYEGTFRQNQASFGEYLRQCIGLLFCRHNDISRLRKEAVTCVWSLFFVIPCIWSLSPLAHTKWYGFVLGLFEIVGLVGYRLDKKAAKYKERCFQRKFLVALLLFAALGAVPYFVA